MEETRRQIKERRPLIHHITNQVSMTFQANAATALGASPIMASHPDEMGEITRHADALVLNLGTPVNLAYPAAFRVLEEQRTPAVVLDPVGIGISPKRLAACVRMLETGKITVLKGNAGEIAALCGEIGYAHGVDAKAGMASELLEEMAAFLAQAYQIIVVVTGESELVVEPTGRSTRIGGGHPWLASVSGSGCVLGTVIAAFLSVARDEEVRQVTAAVRFYRECAQRAAKESSHFGEFPQYLISMIRSVGNE